jgi:pimeloyl-ACP methyl ester carboxylesterase
MTDPGILYVTMQPQPGLSIDQFHEWYNNEHGPTRLRLPQIFTNGLRWRATDGQEPIFLADYDVTSMSHLETETYTSLRANRSAREADTIGQVDVTRSFFDTISSSEKPGFVPAEKLTNEEAEGRVLVSVGFILKDTPEAEEAIAKWYNEEHIPMLSKIPGWLRTRRIKTSRLEGSSQIIVGALHEYEKKNGLGGPEHRAAMSTPWKSDVYDKYVEHMTRRVYELFYVFGPAPRDLDSLSRLPASAAFEAPDGKTNTTPGKQAVIRSFITTADGLEMPFQLEGNSSPTAPTVAFCNSLLTSLHMWDPFVGILKKNRPDLRILRYDTRGRHDVPDPPKPSTLDTLADDISTLLEALRIPKLHSLIGVSMGGATTLKFAIKYPKKLGKFVAADFNAAGSPANTQAWKDRIVVAEGEGIDKLAVATVERWFHPHTMTEKKDVAKWMTDMVATNNVRGFRYGCQALWEYDMKEEMKGVKVPGLFVVGEGDAKGALVKAMEGFKGNLGEKGGELRIVPLAGHLPMAEVPDDFWKAVKDFL